MIAFRHADPRFPFLWESADQPAARWHGEGEGPVQYLSETADGAWAEFLRHEEITDASDLEGIARAIWAVELPDDERLVEPTIPVAVATGEPDSHAACREEARRLRDGGVAGLSAPSAALLSGTPSGWRRTDQTVQGRARWWRTRASRSARGAPA